MNAYGEMPAKDTFVEIDGARFIVDEVDHYRITRVLYENVEKDSIPAQENMREEAEPEDLAPKSSPLETVPDAGEAKIKSDKAAPLATSSSQGET